MDNTGLEADSILGVEVTLSCRMGKPNHMSFKKRDHICHLNKSLAHAWK